MSVAGIRVSWKKYLTTMQIVQFIMGLLWSGWYGVLASRWIDVGQAPGYGGNAWGHGSAC